MLTLVGYRVYGKQEGSLTWLVNIEELNRQDDVARGARSSCTALISMVVGDRSSDVEAFSDIMSANEEGEG